MKIICITGFDGTGKSTLIKSLESQFESVYISGVWDLLKKPISGLPFQSKQQIDNFLCGLTPDSRLLFMAHALKYATDKALASGKDVILLNAYIYKYFASEKALGASEELILSLQKSFPVPDLIIELKVSIDEAGQRKQKLSRYECGLANEPKISSFTDFQHKVAECRDFFGHTNVFQIDTSQSQEDVLAEALSYIENYS